METLRKEEGEAFSSYVETYHLAERRIPPRTGTNGNHLFSDLYSAKRNEAVFTSVASHAVVFRGVIMRRVIRLP